MNRTLLIYLKKWLLSDDRKPMVIRGARQVGKTWIVRQLARECNKELIELNFEKHPAYASLFNSNDPAEILINLGAALKKEINPKQAVLFLDEIQASPELFAKLRWFAEDMPELAVMAAGSLLEFVLAEHAFSVPVGRITYTHLEPLSFEEFLLAGDNHSLCAYLQSYQPEMEIPVFIHEQLLTIFKEYLLVGGMPASVASWVKDHSLQKMHQIQHDLLATYRNDFAKYKGRIEIERLDEVMAAMPAMLGQKFVYSRVNMGAQSTSIKQALDLLCKAKIGSRVISTSANGIPLGAEVDEKYFKVVFLDTGLCSVALGLDLHQIKSAAEIEMINNGGIAEQVVGQLLRTITEPYVEPFLFYWRRSEAGSNAEIDYVMQHGSSVIPIEVKAGATGKLKSLHAFMDLKKLPLAVRISSGKPGVTMVDVKNHVGHQVQYKLLSIPFYLLGQLHRLLNIV